MLARALAGLPLLAACACLGGGAALGGAELEPSAACPGSEELDACGESTGWGSADIDAAAFEDGEGVHLLQMNRHYIIHSAAGADAAGAGSGARRKASAAATEGAQVQRDPAAAQPTEPKVADLGDSSSLLELGTAVRTLTTGGSPRLGSRNLTASPCSLRTAQPLGHLDVLGAVAWTWPDHHEPVWFYALAAFYSSLPAAIAYGLPALLGGSGTFQLLSVFAYWVVVRPAATAQETLFLMGAGCPGVAVGLPATYATASHFYWTWLMLELVTRRRPLWQRLLAVIILSIALLPIPAAQVLLLDRAPEHVASGALLGAILGFGFFFLLHCRIVWEGLRTLETSATHGGFLAYWLRPRDNLTVFWGGSMWPKPPPERRWCKPLPPDLADFLLLENEDELYGNSLKAPAAAKEKPSAGAQGLRDLLVNLQSDTGS